METRDAGFNIMLATDSYKVPAPPGYRGWEGRGDGAGRRGGFDGWKWGKVKVVSSPVPRPTRCNCILSPGLGGPNGAARKEEEGESQIQTGLCIPLLLGLTHASRAVTLLGSSRCCTGCASHNGVTC